ncbi:unnamed protein product [marine sediment metagenome]|uniref:Uncharacterized protein n=1 Tax=marine sediment metagenome TaxID=412755 RepID=X1C919_9ZZZZ
MVFMVEAAFPVSHFSSMSGDVAMHHSHLYRIWDYRAHEEAEGDKMKKMSSKTFREWTELALKIHRKRIERGIEREEAGE